MAIDTERWDINIMINKGKGLERLHGLIILWVGRANDIYDLKRTEQYALADTYRSMAEELKTVIDLMAQDEKTE